MRFVVAITLSAAASLVGASPGTNCTITDFQGLSKMNFGDFYNCTNQDGDVFELCMEDPTLANLTESCFSRLITAMDSRYTADCIPGACHENAYSSPACINCGSAAYAQATVSVAPVGAGACGSLSDRTAIANANFTLVNLCGDTDPKIGGLCLVAAGHASTDCQRCMDDRRSVMESRCGSFCSDPVSVDCVSCTIFAWIGATAYCAESSGVPQAVSSITVVAALAIAVVIFAV